MRNLVALLALVSALAAPHAHAATMNPNPLSLTARAEAEQTARNVVELRLGAGTVGDLFGSGAGPVLTALIERRFSERLSLGVQLSRSSTKYSTLDGFHGEYGYKYTHGAASGRASYHSRELVDDERIDLYGGGLMGYNSFSASAFGPLVQQPLGKTSYMVLGGFTGGCFWFHPKIGVNAEIGYNRGLYGYELGYGGFTWATGTIGLSARL